MLGRRKKAASLVQYVSPDGLAALKWQLETLEQDFDDLRTKLADMRQVKDVEDYDLVEDSMRLAFLEKEITRLRNMIGHCKTLKIDQHADKVRLGSKVRLATENGEMSCMVVSSLEANPSEGKISDQSPLGQALLGKMANALVEVVAPRKNISYRIMGID